MTGIFFITPTHTGLHTGVEEALEHMNQAMRDWTTRAAQGKCSWICSDCCVSFSDGMPNECPHGDQRCTDIIKRDKAEATAKGEI